MKTTAAVLVQTGRPLEIADLDVPTLQPGQALVQVRYSGVCHTQLLECRGHRGRDPFLPHCLGHEGVGIVCEVGRGINRVKPGDTVILSWIKASGSDVPATQYQWDGRTVNAGGVTTFARLAVVSENRLTPIESSLCTPAGAMLGCALPTGMGAVIHTANARPGQRIVIFGLGGVGLCAVLGAALAGCHPIIAVDIQPSKFDAARKLGATHFVNADPENLLEQLHQLCPEGVDLAIEATGQPTVMAMALRCVRPRGGAAVVIGNARQNQSLSIDPGQLNLGKKLLGTWGGDTMPDRDYPRYARMLTDRRIDLSPLVNTTYPLEATNEALDALERGRSIRPIIDMSLTN